MGYVIYEKGSTITIKDKYYISTRVFANEGSAKAHLTRMEKNAKARGKVFPRFKYAIAEAGKFVQQIEKTEKRVNLMSGKEFEQPINTPLCCDPSSETYWSM